MRILVTGANGFLGSHLVERLVERGDEVVALVRPGADTRWLQAVRDHVTLRHATFAPEDAEPLTRACRGVEAICHLAGATRARPESRYHAVNVGGTAALLDAARRARAEAAAGTDGPNAPASPAPAASRPLRVVLCSSLSAGGPAAPGQPKTEQDPDAPRSRYGQSKLQAEKRLWSAAAAAPAGTLEAVALRPGPIYGPRDTYVLEMLRPAARGLHLRVGGAAARYNFCHVRDVAEAFALACRAPGAAGESLYIGDAVNYAPAEFEAIVAEALGTPPRLRLPLPGLLVRGAAELSEGLTWRRRGAPALNRDKARDLVAGPWSMDVTRAGERLGWAPEIDLRAGLAETVAWYRRQGWL